MKQDILEWQAVLERLAHARLDAGVELSPQAWDAKVQPQCRAREGRPHPLTDERDHCGLLLGRHERVDDRIGAVEIVAPHNAVGAAEIQASVLSGAECHDSPPACSQRLAEQPRLTDVGERRHDIQDGLGAR